MGRPRTLESIREIVIRLARETGWGYGRILGELRKLRIRYVSQSTIKNILKEEGISHVLYADGHVKQLTADQILQWCQEEYNFAKPIKK